MSRITSLLSAAARFLIALVIGVGLAVVAQFSLLFFGAERFAGPVLLFGTFAAIALALRFAISGTLTMVDRVAGSAAVLLSGGALIAVAAMAGLAAFGLAAVSVLFSIGGGANTAREYFGPMASQASLVRDLSTLGIVGLAFVFFWLWRKPRSKQQARPDNGPTGSL